jgi:UPF0042 nucleotide-binding protein
MSLSATPPGAAGRTHVVLVTGLSGAGKSTALHALEDLGYFCVDNLPTPLVETTVATCEAAGMRRVALCIDVRAAEFLDGAAQVVTALCATEREVLVLFLDASDDALQRRFSESRRPHPLRVARASEFPGRPSPVPRAVDPQAPPAKSGPSSSVLESVRVERSRLATLRALASVELDTTSLNVHELRRALQGRLDPERAHTARLAVTLVSFGFKYGVPLDANLVFDARFLDNPYFVPALRPQSGRDPAVRAFVLASPDARTLLDHVEQLLAFTVPRYEREGRSYLTVGIGCTGGRHRSVALVEELGRRLTDAGREAIATHRDVERATKGGA